jgi:hypothetical protein
MAELAPLSPLEAWSQRVDLAEAIAEIESTKLRDKVKRRLAESQQSQQEHFGLVEERNGALQIREKPSIVRHLAKHEFPARKAPSYYARTLQEDRRVLLDRYALQDVAFKVVGAGSVGTFCAVVRKRSVVIQPLCQRVR